MVVASGITAIVVTDLGAGQFQVNWTDGGAGTHSQKIDLRSDFGGMVYLIAKAISTGALT